MSSGPRVQTSSDDGRGWRAATRNVLLALAASVAVHLFALFGVPQFPLPELHPAAEPTPLELRIAVQAVPAKEQAPRHAPRTATDQARSARHVQATAAPRRKARAQTQPGEATQTAAPPPVPEQFPVSVPPSLMVAEAASPPFNVVGAPASGQTGQAPAKGPTERVTATAPSSPRSGSTDEVDADRGPAAPARYPFKEVTLEFDLLYGANPMRMGRVTHTLRIEGGHYAIEEVGEGRGLIGKLYERVIGGQLIYRSAGVIGPSGFVPDEFFAQRGRVERREQALFNWEQGSVVLSSRGDQRKLALEAGTQDLVSTVHQLYFMRPLPHKGTLTIATGRKVSTYLFEVIGEESLQTPLGALRTLHVDRVDSDGDRVEFWLDEDHDLLPVRIYSAYRDGLVLDFVIRRNSLVPAD